MISVIRFNNIYTKINPTVLTILDHIHEFCQAWYLWSEGRGLDLADEVLAGSYCSSELLRCLHIGLLCVQDNAADRPTMPDVIFMLSSATDGPQPKRPIFTVPSPVSAPQAQYVKAFSTNEATMSLIEGR